ncbi:MAG: ion channel [Mucilaginibacter sp.]
MIKHSSKKVNPEDDLGFGYQPVIKNQPFINKDGSPNVVRKGLPLFNTSDNYHKLITMDGWKFAILIFGCYLAANIAFALIYLSLGDNVLFGRHQDGQLNSFWEAFFFSAQTLSTVGYGHISPRGMAANSVAAFESMVGLLSFALATGLMYGRFSRPSAKIIYSKNMLIAPYRENKRGLMFRLANKRRNILVDLSLEITFSYNETVDGKTVRRFYPLELERKTVSILTMNWTVVHDIDKNSPLKDFNYDDLVSSEAAFVIILRLFDDAFAQVVNSRTSYTVDDVIWGAKFNPMFTRDNEGHIVLDLGKMDSIEKAELPELAAIEDK